MRAFLGFVECFTAKGDTAASPLVQWNTLLGIFLRVVGHSRSPVEAKRPSRLFMLCVPATVHAKKPRHPDTSV